MQDAQEYEDAGCPYADMMPGVQDWTDSPTPTGCRESRAGSLRVLRI